VRAILTNGKQRREGKTVEKVETKQKLEFDIRVAKVWPKWMRPSCISQGNYRAGRMEIVIHKECPEKRLANFKVQLEKDWQWHQKRLANG